MSDLPRAQKVISGKAISAAPVAPAKNSIYLMAALVLGVMIAWIGFLGWAAYALVIWVIDLVWPATS